MKHLVAEGFEAASIHGNKSQGQRDRALKEFKSGKTSILVATMWQRAASTFPALATFTTTTCRKWRKPMSTGSGAPRGPGGTGRRLPSARRTKSRCCARFRSCSTWNSTWPAATRPPVWASTTNPPHRPSGAGADVADAVAAVVVPAQHAKKAADVQPVAAQSANRASPAEVARPVRPSPRETERQHEPANTKAGPRRARGRAGGIRGGRGRGGKITTSDQTVARPTSDCHIQLEYSAKCCHVVSPDVYAAFVTSAIALLLAALSSILSIFRYRAERGCERHLIRHIKTVLRLQRKPNGARRAACSIFPRDIWR